jgi:hypothetical protein
MTPLVSTSRSDQAADLPTAPQGTVTAPSAVSINVGGFIGGSRFPLARRRFVLVLDRTWANRQRRQREAGPSRDPANVGGHRALVRQPHF